MIAVGIDVSKGSSSVCILKDGAMYDQFVFQHSKPDIQHLISLLLSFQEQPKVVLEATGIYHLPVLYPLLEAGLFVCVINPLLMNKYLSMSLRKVKTDKHDARHISGFALAHWQQLQPCSLQGSTYCELRELGRHYAHYIKLKVMQKQCLSLLLEQAMPGIKALLQSASYNNNFEKDKLLDFVEVFLHFDYITAKTQKQFVLAYCQWAKKKGYQPSESKAVAIYALAIASIPTCSSRSKPGTVRLLEAISVLRQINKTLLSILSHMQQLAMSLPEYEVVRAMPGVGDVLAVRLIGEIGDVRRFRSGKSLVAYAGLDSPPFESGSFVGTRRKISKKGSALLRKTGFEVMTAIRIHKPTHDNAVYLFMVKKEAEGKAMKVAKVAGLNKFLRIYYARVKEVYAHSL